MNLKRLEEEQIEIGNKAILSDPGRIEYVIGVDQAFFRVGREEYVVSASVLMKYPEMEIAEQHHLIEEVKFPYIPTFLMYRESKPAIKAVRAVMRENAVVMVDGSGLAHPRKCGLATYIGVVLDIPTIGITKKRLYGEVRGEGDVRELHAHGMVVGYELKTCRRCRPIYISVGHRFTPEKALEVVRNCLKGYKLPEPVRIADRLSKEIKSEYLSNLDAAL
ncbi:Endonuclease V [Geoglobus ahangari]|uniref:Endonuclease V n=1 Tax=Geoglobus ahangari TaxID=113653 RepID=A0A0F7IF65_9EURY|nr:endonuclease V [Geoglobus ahangari]AKG91678.1 Endonuclease V [Geoglobus ahangari]